MPDQEPSFVRYFAALPDPRVNRTKKHALSDILGVTRITSYNVCYTKLCV